MSATTINRIKNLELFKGCGRPALKQIDCLGTTVDVRAGRTLCLQGDAGSEFFVLVEGVVDVRKPGQRIARLHTGGWFGETALVRNVVRQASVTSETRARVIVFSWREFVSLCSAAPTVSERVERTASLYLGGEEPLTEAWYEPVCRRTTAPGTARTATSHRPNYPVPDAQQRTVRMQGSAHLI